MNTGNGFIINASDKFPKVKTTSKKSTTLLAVVLGGLLHAELCIEIRMLMS